MKTSITCFVLLASFVGIAHGVGREAVATTRRGDQYYLAVAKTQNMHAHDHARLLGKYAAATNEPVPAAIIKEHVAAIRANTELARKSFDRMSATAKNDPAVSKELTEINQRLTKVNELVDQLETQSKQDDTDAKEVMSKANALSQELKATHLASKAIDQVFLQGAQSDNQFSDPQSPDYFFTGEGHFLD